MAVWVGFEGIECSHCTKQQKKIRGCDGFGKQEEIRVFDEKIKIKSCPLREITLETRRFLEAYHFYKRGFLPYGLPWDEQPARLIDAFQFLDGFFADLEKKERENMKKKSEMIRGQK